MNPSAETNAVNALDALEARGLVAQLTGDPAKIRHHLTGAGRTLYCGFDPTADSLHVGSLVPLLALRRMQQAGHRPILLIGGGTGLVGDPSFRAEERGLSEADTVRARAQRLREQVAGLLAVGDGPQDALIVDNLDWLGEQRLLAFLRDVGKHFSVSAMMRRDSVRERLARDDAGMSFAEFSYGLLQALDFVELHRRYGCSLQIGGSDQWGNITGGIDLVRRQLGALVYGLTLPLVTRADGAKFGKTAQGTVWLDPARTSPYAFYQFWVNTPDGDVERMLRWCTLLPLDEIAHVASEGAAQQSPQHGQRALACAVTALVHGESGLRAALRITQALFSGQLASLSAEDLGQLARDGMPRSDVQGDAIGLVEALVESGLARTPQGAVTTGQARKLVTSNAIRVNDARVADVAHVLRREDALHGHCHVLQRGKKQFHMLRWER